MQQLKEEISKLNSLLQDEQPGLLTWWAFFWQRVEKLHELTDRLLMEREQANAEKHEG